MRDVTERKQQETALAQHAAVVEAISDGVLTLSQDRRIVSVNSALEDLLGTSRAELVGSHVEILTELADIADEQALEMGRAITDIDTGATETRTLEASLTDADGIERMSELRFVPVEDKTATVACVVRDITDQYEYERVATSLHEVTRWLLDSDDPEEICAVAVHAGSDLLNLPISGAWLLEEEQGYLEPVAGTADAHDEFGGLPRFNPGQGLVWDVFEAGGVERFDDLEAKDDLYNPDTPIRSEIIAPIGTHGVLMTGSFEANRFDETDVDLVSTLVENTRAALDRADRERILRERSVELERQTERLERVADVLSNDLQQQLEDVAGTLEDDPADDSCSSPSQRNPSARRWTGLNGSLTTFGSSPETPLQSEPGAESTSSRLSARQPTAHNSPRRTSSSSKQQRSERILTDSSHCSRRRLTTSQREAMPTARAR